MSYKCKIFEASYLALDGHYTHICTVSRVIGIKTESRICVPNKEYISVH